MVNILSAFKRNFTSFKKRYSKLRHIVPHPIRKKIPILRYYKSHLRKFIVPIKYESENVNIYHCCIQKTGSVWIGTVLSDPIVYKYSGLLVYPYNGKFRKTQMDKITHITKPYPPDTILSAFKGSYSNFKNDIPKNEGPQKAFFVTRDPRDLVVSWYFSTKKSHTARKGTRFYRIRKKLQDLPFKEGLKCVIDFYEKSRKFDMLRTWVPENLNDDNIKMMRYEDFAGPNAYEVFRELFEFLDIKIPEDEFIQLVDSYSFKSLTGRKPGEEKKDSHLRSGTSGDWKKYFDEELLQYFKNAEDGLTKELGYNW